MNESQLKRYEEITEKYSEWEGWEDGYTLEEGSRFFEWMAEKSLDLLEEIRDE